MGRFLGAEARDLRLASLLQFAGGMHVRYAMGECQRLGLPTSGSGGATPGVDQAKLFVGSLPKDVKEPEVGHVFAADSDACCRGGCRRPPPVSSTASAQVRAVFERYGKVEEVFLMRDNSSWGRLRKGRTGCAFVRFALKEQAFHAIANLSGKYTMPGGSACGSRRSFHLEVCLSPLASRRWRTRGVSAVE